MIPAAKAKDVGHNALVTLPPTLTLTLTLTLMLTVIGAQKAESRQKHEGRRAKDFSFFDDMRLLLPLGRPMGRPYSPNGGTERAYHSVHLILYVHSYCQFADAAAALCCNSNNGTEA